MQMSNRIKNERKEQRLPVSKLIRRLMPLDIPAEGRPCDVLDSFGWH
jgi:hypothetical protein